jgi:hypothetical protein
MEAAAVGGGCRRVWRSGRASGSAGYRARVGRWSVRSVPAGETAVTRARRQPAVIGHPCPMNGSARAGRRREAQHRWRRGGASARHGNLTTPAPLEARLLVGLFSRLLCGCSGSGCSGPGLSVTPLPYGARGRRRRQAELVHRARVRPPRPIQVRGRNACAPSGASSATARRAFAVRSYCFDEIAWLRA